MTSIPSLFIFPSSSFFLHSCSSSCFFLLFLLHLCPPLLPYLSYFFFIHLILLPIPTKQKQKKPKMVVTRDLLISLCDNTNHSNHPISAGINQNNSSLFPEECSSTNNNCSLRNNHNGHNKDLSSFRGKITFMFDINSSPCFFFFCLLLLLLP